MRKRKAKEPKSLGDDSNMNLREGESPLTVAVQQVREILAASKLPRTSRWIRRRQEGEATLRVHSALHHLENRGEIEYLRDGTWRVRATEAGSRSRGAAIWDPMRLVGPVWEPRVVEALKAEGLPVEQQRHELSYYLDIAVCCANGKKLNVEVDGRTHRSRDGRRRRSDVVRDARLHAEGWLVHRIWVRDLIKDFDAQIKDVVQVWKMLEGDEVHGEVN